MTETDQIFILAGGYGTRLGEITKRLPKPMVEVAGQPFISYKLQEVRESGLKRVVMCVGYLGEEIRAFVGDGSKWDLQVEYSFDGARPIGTLAALNKALRAYGTGSHALVTYGDSLVQMPFSGLLDTGQRAKAEQSVITWSKPDSAAEKSLNVTPSHENQVKYGQDARAKGVEHGLSLVSTARIGSYSDPSKNLSDFFLSESQLGNVLGVEVEEQFLEIGTPESLAQAQVAILESRFYREV